MIDRKQYEKQWRLDNRDRVKETRKEYYLENKQQILLESIRFKKNNPMKVKQYAKKHRMNNKEKVANAIASWKKRNPEKVKATKERFKLKHPNYYYERIQKDPNRRRNVYYKTNVDELIKKQNGKCAICDKEVKLMVDHCHISNKVRGLLCKNCNLGLGRFFDSVDILEKAKKYLLKSLNT